MSDRILNFAWNGLILSLVVVLGAAALALTYSALLQLVSKRLEQGITPLVAGAALGTAVYFLIRHRGDLVGREC